MMSSVEHQRTSQTINIVLSVIIVITHIMCSYSGLAQWRISPGDSDSRKLTDKNELYEQPQMTSNLS